MSFVFLFTVLLSLCYVGLIGAFTIAWPKTITIKSASPVTLPSITVIIPVRNEEHVIESCLGKIISQLYPSGLVEIIVVDDHSTDRTAEAVQHFIDNNDIKKQIRLIHSKPSTGKAFKKNAINQAIHLAKGDLIITTDADCEARPQWLLSIGNFYGATGCKMITGPVVYHKDHTLLGKMQTLEFISLVASGASSLNLGLPLMCNGANLTFEKDAFFKVKGYEDNAHIPSGDDTFLMMKLQKEYPGKVRFIADPQAMVYTEAVNSLSGFVNQRKRWSSKTKHYKSFYIKSVAVLILLLNFLILAFLGAYVIKGLFLKELMFLLLSKSVIDIVFLSRPLVFFKRRDLLIYFLPSQFLYPFYVVFIGLMAQWGTYKWKERKI